MMNELPATKRTSDSIEGPQTKSPWTAPNLTIIETQNTEAKKTFPTEHTVYTSFGVTS